MPKRLIGDIWSWYQVGTNLIKNILFSGWAHFSNTKNLKLRKLGCSIISVTPRGKEYSIINIINLNPSSELTTALEFTTQGNKIKIWKCWEPLYSRPNCSHQAWGEREWTRKEIEIKIYSATNALLHYLEFLHIFSEHFGAEDSWRENTLPMGFSMHFQSPQHRAQAEPRGFSCCRRNV